MRPPQPITTLLVDDDAFNREGMRLYLEQEGFAILEAGDAATAWQELGASKTDAPAADAAVVDISLPAEPGQKAQPNCSVGIQLAGRIKDADPAFGIVLFSAYEDRGAEVLELIQEGRRGIAYKLKGCQPAALLAALRGVMAGQVIIDPEVTNVHSLADRLAQCLAPEERAYVEAAVDLLAQLTPREREVADRVAAAHSNEGIARELAIAPKSVENYVSRIYDKLRLNDAPHHLRRVVLLAKACMISDLRGQFR
jgi:DNA-binding NarL/FixJ family response regulator